MKDCYRKALDLLARRAHFRAEIEAKLVSRGFDGEELTGTLARLENEGYLDDRAAALGLVQGSLRRKGYGPRRVSMELIRRGLDADLASEIVRSSFAEGESGLARETAERWLRSHRPREDKGPREALARHLARKGYSSGTILSLLDDLDLPY